jgi:hypothetical protein
MNVTGEHVLVIDAHVMSLDRCVSVIRSLLHAVRFAARDYYNSTPVLTLPDTLGDDAGSGVCWSNPVDLKTLAVIAALVQAPVALRGDTDRGKTALSERILTGLFGRQGHGWQRMEINRGLTVDDLIDINVEKLSHTTVTEAMSAAKWLGNPGYLLDEISRAHPKLLNLLLHLVDGSGFNIRGDVFVPVGLPYRIGDEEKRYSFSMVTANPPDRDYAGVFEEDAALTRRIVISVDLDQLPPTSRDVALMMSHRRARSTPPHSRPLTPWLISVHEALPKVLEFSATAELFLHYLAAMSTCVRTRSGRFQPRLKSTICTSCHLSKANRYCGRLGALGEGLLLWVKDLAVAIAAVRGCMVLDQARRHCLKSQTRTLAIAELQAVTGTHEIGKDLYRCFRRFYLDQLRITGEDVKAAYLLIAPGHAWIDSEWLKNQTTHESNPLYLLREVAEETWGTMVNFLREHRALLTRVAASAELTDPDQAQLEQFVTTRDAAMLGVIQALRDSEVPLRVRENLRGGKSMTVA